MIKLRTTRLAGHVESMGDIRNAYGISVGNLGEDSSEDLGVDGRIILK
jgi:hypothetical protein